MNQLKPIRSAFSFIFFSFDLVIMNTDYECHSPRPDWLVVAQESGGIGRGHGCASRFPKWYFNY